MYNTMNSEQKNIFCEILHHARNSHAHVHNNTFFIEEKPGCGKTFLVDALKDLQLS
jgi:chromosomal replication initiation ATPase DnaA